MIGAVLLKRAGPARRALRHVANGHIEHARVRAHLRLREAQLRRVDDARLSPDLRRARRANLDRLHEYWVAGRFPVNSFVARRRVPILRDASGTACAVGYLLERSGRGDLLEPLALADNHLRIREVKEGPLLAWLADSGLTVEEAARIQPSYEPQFDFNVFVAVLLALLLPLKILAGALLAQIRTAPPLGARLLRTGASLAASTAIALGVVAVLQPTFDPVAPVFRLSMVAAVLAFLAPLEFLTAWLLDRAFPVFGRNRILADAPVTIANVACSSALGSIVVWLIVPVWY